METSPGVLPIAAAVLVLIVAGAGVLAVGWSLLRRPHTVSGGSAAPTLRLAGRAADPVAPGDPDRVGPYRVHARLGEGGMGTVYLGSSPGGLRLAVKLAHPALGRDAEFRRRFATEVEAAQRVGGFFTAQVVDADPGAERPWLATAYIPGLSLQTAVRDHGPLPPASVAALGAGLAEGLMAVHAAQLVHRDLKPGNVILTAEGPRLIDFGIARALDATSVTSTSTVLGTAAFMAPEQVTGAEVRAPADVFALGCVLAFAATGRSPFGEGPAHAVAYRIVHAEADLSQLSAPLAGLVGECLAKDPADRPGLNRVLAELGDQAPAARGSGSGGWLPDEVTEAIDRQEPTPSSYGPGPELGGGRPSPAPPTPARRWSAAARGAALVSLITVPAVPVAAPQMVNAGSVTSADGALFIAVCAALAATLAFGALRRDPLGSRLMAVGGAGLALQTAYTVAVHGEVIANAVQMTLPLTAFASACAALLALGWMAAARR